MERQKYPKQDFTSCSIDIEVETMFSSKYIASEMQWHKDKRVETNGVLRHPVDAEVWKCFDRKFP